MGSGAIAAALALLLVVPRGATPVAAPQSFAVAQLTGPIDGLRIATRYDKLARNYLASVCLAAALVWWI